MTLFSHVEEDVAFDGAPSDPELFAQFLAEEDEKNRNCEHDTIDQTEGYRGGLYAICEDCGLCLGEINTNPFYRPEP